ncbi:HEAT repeat protein [Gemmata obscuriglobus]|uniref:HEAT repeat domain-containing protein n=1 Tax=Gemmata obscuriglobus TaxID=114 RepID=A0A2Z3H5A4_9BACT|nr:HEAT repeat domain-containing protein [Gemmata obscuriglobus]AWM36210.1 HEAT repeat domain-containing protein [Gemmata obscuriglobus]QEG31194.1 HEAT repeat protein [Gemmata obscuriglobus]VTS10532.1 heat repeat-containing protein : HEAT repeat-containing protein OS=Leptolyngbya sp. PCC 7375 GN=Lepto7375DRAFT_2567 PE=4 SV=1: HEAT_2 [Gemmata obscuriglobus UQM 2246]
MKPFCALLPLLLGAVPISAAPVPERVPGLVKTLKNGKPGERVVAAELLGDLGPKAEGAVQALVEVIRSTPAPAPIPFADQREWSREEAAADFLLKATWDALERIGPKAVPALTELLTHPDAEIRERASAVLGAIGPGAADAVPALIKCLSEGEHQQVTLNALNALAAIGPKAEAAVPALIKTALDPRAMVPEGELKLPLRNAAAKALVAIGAKALPAVRKDLFPAIIKAIDDADERGWLLSGSGWGNAWSTWAPFGADAAPLVPAIVRYLSRHNQDRLVLSLLKLGPDGQKALAGLLSDKDEQVRKEQLNALCEHAFGTFVSEGGFHCRAEADLRPIARELIPFLADKDYGVRFHALVAINQRCRPAPPEVVRAALPLLNDKEFLSYRDKRYEIDAAAVIGFCGPAAIPKLVEHLQSDDTKLREFAVRALKDLRGPGTEALLPALRERAAGRATRPEMTPLDAAISAVRISLAPKDVELLVPFLKSGDPKERLTALVEFRQLRHLARPHLKHLFPLLRDRNLRWNAALTIDAIDSSDPDVCAALAQWIADYGDRRPLERTDLFAKEIAPAIPAVLKMLEGGRGFDLVQRIGPPAKDAVPLLLSYLTREPTFTAREGFDPNSALRALGTIGPAAKGAVPLIRARLARVEDREKMWCLLCLADIGPGARDAVPELKELLTDPDPRLRLLAACALSKIEADPAAYRATFARAIHERPNSAFWHVPLVLDRIAADCPELVPRAVRGAIPRLNEPHVGWGDFEPEYVTLIPLLKRNALLAKGAVPELVNGLNKPSARGMQPELIGLLGAIGPDAKAALPKLRELRDGAEFEIAIAALEAIQKIEATRAPNALNTTAGPDMK